MLGGFSIRDGGTNMSDPIEPQEPAGQGDPDKLGDGGKKALETERAARKAAEARAATAESRVTELETQIGSLEATHQQALEAATQAASDAESRATSAESDTLRYKVALETGVPARHIGRLQGDTEEALREDAASFVADIVPGKTTPKPDLSQGPQGDAPKQSTADQFASQLADF
jgi:hypothetical protein